MNTTRYNQAAIMQCAHDLWRQHHEMVASCAAAGGCWAGKPVTFAKCLKRAWEFAKCNRYYVERGSQTDSAYPFVLTMDGAEIVAINGAVVDRSTEMKRAA